MNHLNVLVAVLATIADSVLPVLAVIGNNVAVRGQFPYQLKLHKQGNGHVCGAVLIGQKVALTAAHCTNREGHFALSVVAGIIDRFDSDNKVRVDRVLENPLYNPKHNENDLAILFLRKAIKYNKFIQPIKLPRRTERIPDGALATVSGWGLEGKSEEKSQFLKYAPLPIWTAKACDAFLFKNIKSPVYCGGEPSGNNNACDGDSGGPLVYDNKLFGIVSFGFSCGTPKKPVIYTNVPAFRAWIFHKTGI